MFKAEESNNGRPICNRLEASFSDFRSFLEGTFRALRSSFLAFRLAPDEVLRLRSAAAADT